MSESGNSQFFICECGETFQNENLVRVHLERCHPRTQLKTTVRHLRKVPPPITEYKCGECGNIYPTEEECVTHQEIDHIPYMEELEYPEGDDVEDLIIPDVIIPSTSHDTSPDELSTTLSTLPITSPVRVQSLPAKQPTPEYDYPESQPKPKRKNTYKYLGVQCETCGKKYGSDAALRYHQRVHTGDKPYKCPYCPKAFTMALFLQVHVRIHTGEKPYSCSICPKAFTNKAALLRHDRVHTGIKPYQCPKCLKSFTQSNSLKLHFHTVHLKMPTPYKSKRRRAETEAKAEMKYDPGQVDTVALLNAVMRAPDEYYEINTPAGRKITLTPIVPRKVQEQLEGLPALPSHNSTDENVMDDNVMYYGIKTEQEDEEITYEVVYE